MWLVRYAWGMKLSCTRSLAIVAALVGALVGALPAQVAVKRHFDDSGFDSLFDGKTLEGWVTQGGRYDGKAEWTVVHSAITGRQNADGAGGLLYTARSYTNFIFTCDTLVSYPFDSGVFVRMVPRGGGKGAQITLDYRPKGEVGAVYSDGFLQHNETAKKKFVRGKWNHVEVRCVGRDMHLQTWLNGELITDFQMPAGSDGYAPRGLIGVQVHGGRDDPPGLVAQFKNIKIRELPDYDVALFSCDARGMLTPTEAAIEAGWTALFDGSDLQQWEPVGEQKGYVVESGILGFAGQSGYLRTVKDFRDFELRLDFKTARMANSGLFLRGDRAGGGSPASSGCELQILDDFNWEKETKTKLQPWQFTGSLYHSVAPAEPALAPIGSWNTFDVRFKGSKIRVVLNGCELYDVDTTEVPTNGWPAFADRAVEGFIGLQRHSHGQGADEQYVWFKNIFIRPL